MTTASKATIKKLWAEVRRLGITAESAGCQLDELIRQARDQDDPLGYLAIHAPIGDAAAGVSEETAADESPAEVSKQDEKPIAETPKPPSLDPPAPDPQSIVSISVPLSTAGKRGCYISKHVEIRMTHEQGVTLRRLHLALDTEGARLANGRRVIHLADAVKWLLEQIESGPAESGPVAKR